MGSMADKTVIRAVCIGCGYQYDQLSGGSLGCHMHTGPLDSNSHYTCCGMSDSRGTCIAHAEATREMVPGCRSVDHCGMFDERRRLLTRPYGVCSLAQAQAMPAIATANNKTVFHFETQDGMPTSICIDVPKPLGDHEGKLEVNLVEEHAQLRLLLVASVDEFTHSTDPYECEWDASCGHVESATPDFVPFALFMRVSAEMSPTRGKNYAKTAATACRHA